MSEKLIEWSSWTNWVMTIIRFVTVALLMLGLKQYNELSNTVRELSFEVRNYKAIATIVQEIKTSQDVMSGNRFTNIQGDNHERRLTVIETRNESVAEDISEIKADMKLLLRK